MRALTILLLPAIIPLSSCSLAPRRTAPSAYAQYVEDSVSAHCKYRPEACAQGLAPHGLSPAPAGLAPEGGNTAQWLMMATLAATVVATEALDRAMASRVEEVLTSCADLARAEVLKRRFGGRSPTFAECLETVEEGGKRRTLAMLLGDQMHKIAFDCVQAVYDFKFPCASLFSGSNWREYPQGHPFGGKDQGQIYQEALGHVPSRVSPGRGVW